MLKQLVFVVMAIIAFALQPRAMAQAPSIDYVLQSVEPSASRYKIIFDMSNQGAGDFPIRYRNFSSGPINPWGINIWTNFTPWRTAFVDAAPLFEGVQVMGVSFAAQPGFAFFPNTKTELWYYPGAPYPSGTQHYTEKWEQTFTLIGTLPPGGPQVPTAYQN